LLQLTERLGLEEKANQEAMSLLERERREVEKVDSERRQKV
jgi:hypothetical protein